MSINMSVSTRLDAINFIIGAMGLAPVPSEDFYNLDSARAALCLDNYSRTIQNHKGEGWWFNCEPNWEIAPDSVNGYVTLPNTAIAVFFQRHHIDYFRDWRGCQGRKLSTRGRLLYDTFSHSYDMRPHVDKSGNVRLAIITQLDFGDLPQTAKDAITLAATVQHLMNNEMDVNRIKLTEEYAQQRFFDLEAENMSQLRTNAFAASPSMQLFTALGGGYNNR